ncbi:DNA repair protein RadC [Paenibacillus vini]|uniref:RadC family protein n=1 Tax=Paenibacillus vini TaxID=1476024 RepID=UPI0025B69193|nr:DNA repair protein RadC [Paenibacillus vini]MDN4067538.1 DNA repair protein RadC [Paenibacillus vini]
MSTTATFNNFAVREVRNTFYRTCDPNRLSDRDLLVLILGPIVRDRCLSTMVDQVLEKGLAHLATLSEIELSMILGLDEQQCLLLMSIFEVGRRMNLSRPEDQPCIASPEAMVKECSDIRFLEKEHFVILYLNTKNRVIGRETVSVGSLNAAIVHPREVFRGAIRRGSASVICAHNHPSGDPTPSQEDIDITKRLAQAGELVGIDLLDHVILGRDNHTSLKQSGYF